VGAAARIYPPPLPPPAARAVAPLRTREKYGRVEGWHTAVSSRERNDEERREEVAEVVCSSIVGRGYLGKSRSRKVEQ